MVDARVPVKGSAGWPSRPFRPAWWLRSGHAQTLAGKLLRRLTPPELTTERIETSDGDFFDVEWGADPGPEAPICLVLHGLEGNARRPYALMLHRAPLERGIRPLGLHFRSCSGEPNRTARFYHSGETSDLDHLVRIVRARHRHRPLLAVGFSLGGNVLLKYLGELGHDGPGVFSACATISVPFDLAAGIQALDDPFLSPNALPTERIASNPHLVPAFSSRVATSALSRAAAPGAFVSGPRRKRLVSWPGTASPRSDTPVPVIPEIPLRKTPGAGRFGGPFEGAEALRESNGANG